MVFPILSIITLIISYFLVKRNNDKAEVNAKLAETINTDRALKEQQQEIEAAIATLDAGIEKAKEQRENAARKAAEDRLTLKERRDRIRKGLK